MAFNLDNNIHGALRGVAEALRLDGNNQNKEAYTQYLRCAQYIVQCLLEDAKDLSVPASPCRKKFVKLGQQCMDRVANIVDDFDINTNSSVLSSFTSCPMKPDPPVVVNQLQPLPHAQPGEQTPGSDSLPSSASIEKSKPNVSESRAKLHPSPSSGSRTLPSPGDTSATNLSPMEIAVRQNKALMEAYKARVANMRSGKVSTTAMSLTVQRKMAENIALAKARQQALDRKMKERQARYQEMAAKRFNESSGMCKEEEQRRQLYAKILEYEQDQKWPQTWRKMLSAKPQDVRLIRQLIKHILGSDDHPLTQLLKRYQYDVYDKLKPIVSKQFLHFQQTNQEFQKALVSLQKNKSKTDTSTATIARISEVGETGVKAEEETIQDINEENMTDFLTAFQSSKDDVVSAVVKGEILSKMLEEDEIAEMDNESTDSKSDETEKSNTVSEISDTSILTKDENVSEDNAIRSERGQGVLMKRQNSHELSVAEMEKTAFSNHLKHIIRDVHMCLDKLIAMFTDTYEQLDTPTGRDQCHVLLEEPFFKPLWPYLIVLFRTVCQKEEGKLTQTMLQNSDILPSAVGVREKWWLKQDNAIDDYPYKVAVDELRKIASYMCPLEKLECIVRVSRMICQCVEEYCCSKEETTANIGADDLLPILSYVVVKCQVPQLVSECHAMEEFIHEGYLMGEEGYCLTSLQTAVSYVINQFHDNN